MSEEYTKEIFQAEQNDIGKHGASGKSNGRKWGIVGAIVVILIVLIVGFCIYNMPSNRLSRQLDLGNRYLEEQNYEQAIVEFDKAIAIDPMSVDAYLGKTEAYIRIGNLQAALETLQIGYDFTGDERLREKIEEINEEIARNRQAEETANLVEEEIERLVVEEDGEEDYIELSFSISDNKIMGYDLLGPHFDEVVKTLGVSLDQHTTDGVPVGQTVDQYGVLTATDRSGYRTVDIMDGPYGDNNMYYEWLLYANEDSSCLLFLYDYIGITGKSYRDDMEDICDLLFFPGDTYEEWCEKLKISVIKSSIEGQYDEETNATSWFSVMDSQKILSQDKWYVNVYQESEDSSYGIITLFDEEGVRFDIRANFEDGIIMGVIYTRSRDSVIS